TEYFNFGKIFILILLSFSTWAFGGNLGKEWTILFIASVYVFELIYLIKLILRTPALPNIFLYIMFAFCIVVIFYLFLKNDFSDILRFSASKELSIFAIIQGSFALFNVILLPFACIYAYIFTKKEVQISAFHHHFKP
ncbi:hypothetical protein, partial [Helicobacter turcicus]